MQRCKRSRLTRWGTRIAYELLECRKLPARSFNIPVTLPETTPNIASLTHYPFNHHNHNRNHHHYHTYFLHITLLTNSVMNPPTPLFLFCAVRYLQCRTQLSYPGPTYLATLSYPPTRPPHPRRPFGPSIHSTSMSRRFY